MAEIENNRITNPPRIRTLPKAYEEIKKLDSNTCFTMAALRNMCRNGEIPTFKIGKKTLLNLDFLLDTLAFQAGAQNRGDAYGDNTKEIK